MADAAVRFRVRRSEFEDYKVDDDHRARERLDGVLLAALQLEKLAVLCGAGTSIGAGGPSMRDLWVEVVGDPETAGASEVIGRVRYDRESRNVEDLLSRCDAFLHIQDDADVHGFREEALGKILSRCRKIERDKIEAHQTFLIRLARRRARDARVKLFTTNYDTCFESAASAVRLTPIDGFSFIQPRRFDARFFDYDIVRRGRSSDPADFIPGVFQYFKLHGSVNWRREGDDIVVDAAAPPTEAALIYPAKSKYQRAFEQPHLELMAHYLGTLRQNNTSLLVAGFGFNDDHIARPILAAVESNPHFQLVIVDPRGEELLRAPPNPAWKLLRTFADRDRDITVIAATFERFVALIPDLNALSHPGGAPYGVAPSEDAE